MKIVIFGATGGTGRELVRQALAQGHQVTVFARNPGRLMMEHEDLPVVRGTVLDPEAVEAAVSGQEAALSALGALTLKKNTILSDGTKNIIEAMEKCGVRRFVCESSLGVGDSNGQLGFLYDYILIPFFMRHVFADKEVQERYIRESSLDWIIVRPAALTNGPRTGVYRALLAPERFTGKPQISRADTAEFMLKQLTENTYLRKTPGLAY